MNIERYIGKMMNIRKYLLKFIDNEIDNEENFSRLIKMINDEKIIDDKFEFKSLIHLISKISNNHHQTNTFYSKIEQILSLYINQIQTYFTNADIFNIFKSNKRLLLFLFEEKIIIFDQFIFKKITNNKYKESNYYEYFLPEIKEYLNDKQITDDIPEDFYAKRKKGQNDEYICELIRNDSVKEFIIFINKRNYPLSYSINPSIYETNQK